jgi:hypothetical protein
MKSLPEIIATNAHKPTVAEVEQSAWTWNRLRRSDKRILAVAAGIVESDAWWSSPVWSELTEKQRQALMQIDWNKAFTKA